MLPRQYAIKSCFIFPPHLTGVSTYLVKQETQKLLFYLNVVCCFVSGHKNIKIVKPSFTVKTIDCMHQTGPTGRKLERLDMSPTCSMITMSAMVSVAVSKMNVKFYQTWNENQQTVLLGYLTVSTNIKRYEARY